MNAEANQADSDSGLNATISRVANRVFATQVLLGVLSFAATCIGLWLALFLLDNFLQLPSAIRFPLACGAVAATLYLLWRLIICAMLRRKTRDQIAVMLERKHGIGGNVVINSLQFANASVAEAQRPFVNRTLDIGAEKLAVVSLGDLAETRRLLKWGGLLLGVLLILGGYFRLAPDSLGSAASRYFYSLSDAPPATSSLVLTVTPAEDISIAETEDVEVRVVVSGLKPGEPLEEYPELYWKEGEDGVSSVRGKGSRVIMHPVLDAENTYRHKFSCVRSSFSFRIFAADAYTRSIRVKVSPAPKITASQCRVTLPWYTGGRVLSALGPPHPVECLPQSKLDIELEMNRACRSVLWRTADSALDFRQEGSKWKARYPVKRGGPYDVEIEAEDLEEEIVVASGVMSLLADEPPSVDILDAVANRTVTPGEKITVTVRAQDHYGLRDVRIKARPALGGSEPRTMRTWLYGDSRVVNVEGKEITRAGVEEILCEQLGTNADKDLVKRAVEHFATIIDETVRVDLPPGDDKMVHETATFTIDASIFQPGYKYYIEAVARDFCPDNDSSVSKALMITVRDIEGVNISDDTELGKLFAFLDQAIKHQKKAIENTDTLVTHADSLWKDMHGNPFKPEDVNKFLGLHRRSILGEQGNVRNVLIQAGRTTAINSPIVTRLKQISENEAVDANDQASMLNGVTCDLGLGPAVFRDRMNYADEDPTISLKQVKRARYFGLQIDSSTRWDENTALGSLTLWDEIGSEIPSEQWKVMAIRGGEKTKINAQPWAGAGPLPHFLVVDMGTTANVAKMKIDKNGSTMGRYRFFLAEKWTGKVDVPAMPDQETLLRNAQTLKEIQETIYNQLIALKGREIVKKEHEDQKFAEEALYGDLAPSAPVEDDALKTLQDQLADWHARWEKNRELRERIMNKLPEDLSEEEQDQAELLVNEQEILGRELQDYIDDFEASANMDLGDSQRAKIQAEILTKLEEIRQLQNEAVAVAKKGDFSEALEDQIAFGMEGAAGVSKKDDDVQSGDVPGGTENPEGEGTVPYVPKLANKLNTVVEELAEPIEAISEDLSHAATSFGGALGTNPQENVIGGQYSSMAAAGQMGDVTPDPMKNAAGRAGPGRSGQSDGQFVGDTAPLIPDDEVAMPNRMSDTSMEGGKDVGDYGLAPPTSTGMGKSTTSPSDFGKTGRMPPGFYKKFVAVEEKVDNFEESAQDMLMFLSNEGLSSGDLKMAVQRLRSLREAMRKGDGVGVRQSFDEFARHFRLARTNLLRELERRAAENKQWEMRREHVAQQTLADLKEYEEIIGEYFKRVAETGEE